MSILFELAVLVAIVWVSMQVWQHWVQKHPVSTEKGGMSALHEQLQLISQRVLDFFRGRGHWKRKLLAVLAAGGLLMFFGFPRILYVAVIVAGVIAISTLMKQLSASPTASSTDQQPNEGNTPPPLPAEVKIKIHRAGRSRFRRPDSTEPKEGFVHRFFRFVTMCLLFALGGLIFFEFDTVQRVVRNYIPQAREMFDDHQVALEARIHRRHQSIDDHVDAITDHLDKQVEQALEVTEKAVEDAQQRIEDSLDRARKGRANPAQQAPPAAPVPPAKVETVLDVPKRGAVVRFQSEPASSAGAAMEAMTEEVGRFLVLAAIANGRSEQLAAWHPDGEWVRRSFLADAEIVETPSETNGVTLFVASAPVETPGEDDADRIWNRYLSDVSGARSLLLLKGYAGSMLVAGGLAIFLRLGTSRHVGPMSVWFKKHGSPRTVPV